MADGQPRAYAKGGPFEPGALLNLLEAPDPLHPEAVELAGEHYRAGIGHNSRGDFELAALAFEAAHRVRPRVSTLLCVANMRLKMGHAKPAAHIYRAIAQSQLASPDEAGMAARKLLVVEQQDATLSSPETPVEWSAPKPSSQTAVRLIPDTQAEAESTKPAPHACPPAVNGGRMGASPPVNGYNLSQPNGASSTRGDSAAAVASEGVEASAPSIAAVAGSPLTSPATPSNAPPASGETRRVNDPPMRATSAFPAPAPVPEPPLF